MQSRNNKNIALNEIKADYIRRRNAYRELFRDHHDPNSVAACVLRDIELMFYTLHEDKPDASPTALAREVGAYTAAKYIRQRAMCDRDIPEEE